jgi:hypothetical protein
MYVIEFTGEKDSLTDINIVSEITGLTIEEIKQSFKVVELPN